MLIEPGQRPASRPASRARSLSAGFACAGHAHSSRCSRAIEYSVSPAFTRTARAGGFRPWHHGPRRFASGLSRRIAPICLLRARASRVAARINPQPRAARRLASVNSVPALEVRHRHGKLLGDPRERVTAARRGNAPVATAPAPRHGIVSFSPDAISAAESQMIASLDRRHGHLVMLRDRRKRLALTSPRESASSSTCPAESPRWRLESAGGSLRKPQLEIRIIRRHQPQQFRIQLPQVVEFRAGRIGHQPQIDRMPRLHESTSGGLSGSDLHAVERPDPSPPAPAPE